MPPKSSANSLTGGTGDVNPQWAKPPTAVFGAQTPASGAIQQTITIPFPQQPFAPAAGKSIIVEILKTRYGVGCDFVVGNSAGLFNASLVLSTAPPAVTSPATYPSVSSGRTIDWHTDEQILVFPVEDVDNGMSGFSNLTTTYPVTHDLTDGAGHGILVATPNIYFTATGAVYDIAPGSATPYDVVPLIAAWAGGIEILYRWKQVSLQEYIGIVQSQGQN